MPLCYFTQISKLSVENNLLLTTATVKRKVHSTGSLLAERYD
jgi:hypothetical protein